MAASISPPTSILPPTTPPVSTLPPAQIARLRQTAQDFEAMAIGQLLQPIFDTVDTSKGPFGGGAAEATWKPMLVNEIARHMTAHGGLGLAQPIFTQMLRMQEAAANKENGK